MLATSEGGLTATAPFTTKSSADATTATVEGFVTTPGVDDDGQVLDPDFAATALREWFDRGGAIHAMGQGVDSVGKAVSMEVRSAGVWIRAQVTSPDAVTLTKSRVYVGFSVLVSQPRIIKDGSAPNGRVVGGRVVAVQLVDRPENPAARFIAKRAAQKSGPVVQPASDRVAAAQQEELNWLVAQTRSGSSEQSRRAMDVLIQRVGGVAAAVLTEDYPGGM